MVIQFTLISSTNNFSNDLEVTRLFVLFGFYREVESGGKEAQVQCAPDQSFRDQLVVGEGRDSREQK